MNMITLLLVGLFALPVAAGVFRPFSGDAEHALIATVKRLEPPAALIFSFFAVRLAFTHPESGLWTILYSAIPPLQDSVINQDIWIFLIGTLVLFVLLLSVLRLGIHLLTAPVLRPLAHFVSGRLLALPGGIRRLLGGLARLPGAVALVAAFSLLFHFYTVYAANTALGDYVSQSAVYRVVDSNLVQPTLSSNFTGKTTEALDALLEHAVQSISLISLPSVTYLNGMTLRDAVSSSDELDALAQSLTEGVTEDREKAYLLYLWVCNHVSYDYQKAETLQQDFLTVSSGALDAFSTSSGVCFDYACLYISMCRATGVGVRFVLGEGLSGGEWASHAWNQIYDPAEDRWINVDPTFGSTSGDWFDPQDFFSTHTQGSVLGQW